MVDSISQIASALESAKMITMEAAALATSRLGESSYTHYSRSLNPQQLKTLLNSRNSREVKDAMKRILSVLASGDQSIDIESFFTDVVKNISSDDVKVKRMVYVYLLRYAEKNPNLALLSVNAIQKSLSDSDPEIRAFSLKALSDIRIPSLCPIVLLSLKKLIVDPSSVVRCEVAYSLLKLYRWKQDEFEEEIEELFKELLCDSELRVISTTILLFKECFSNRLELLHGHYRYFCQILNKLDSWAQSYLIEALIRYCKTYLPKPSVIDITSTDVENNFIPLPDKYNRIMFPAYELRMDPDLELFINSLKTLRYSSNPIVILSGCNAFFQLTTPIEFKNSRFPEALIKNAVATPNVGVKTLLLQSALLYSKLDSTLFLQYYKDFLLLPSDTSQIACLKLEVLSTLINDSNVEFIIHELKRYINYEKDEKVVVTASRTMASCSVLSVALESHIMKWFINTMEIQKNSLTNDILDCFVNIIRELVSNNPKRHLKIILKLSKILKTNNVRADNARAGIIWLFGEIAGVEFKICPDVLRELIPNFVNEGPESRRQIILLSAKLLSYEISINEEEQTEGYILEESRIMKMFQYLSYLGKFDDDYDIRDKVRYLTSIFDSQKYEIAALLLQAPKPKIWGNGISNEAVENEDSKDIDKDMILYHEYIPWEEKMPEGSNNTDLRESLPLKDYNKFKKSFSSSTPPTTAIDTTRVTSNNTISKKTTNSFTSNNGKKYRLQSLDEFFSDVPAEPTIKKSSSMPKKVITIEESTSEEETDSSEEEEESSEDGSESSSLSDTDGDDI